MEPGAMLLQMVGNPGKVPSREWDLEPIRALYTLAEIPVTLASRVSLEFSA